MAANTQPIFPVAAKNPSITITNGDAQTIKTAYTAGTNGGRVSKLMLSSTDTSARDVGIYLGGSLLGCVSVPAGAGQTSSVPPVDALASLGTYYDASGNNVLDVQASTVLGVNAPVTLTAAKVVTAVVVAGDF